MARGKRNLNSNYPKSISTAVTELQKNEIIRLSKKCNTTVSSYLRLLIQSHILEERQKENEQQRLHS